MLGKAHGTPYLRSVNFSDWEKEYEENVVGNPGSSNS